MTKTVHTLLALLALCLAGCAPFVVESKATHFSPSEYVYPLVDGNYAVTGTSFASTKVVNRPDHVEITMTEKNGDPQTLLGGFIALKTPGYFIFQATDASEGGKRAEKKAEESIYIPVHFAKTGQVDWLVGQKRGCDADCVALFASSGFQMDGDSGWRSPKGLSRAQLLAFYESLAPLLERNPEAWDSVKALRIEGT